jgi:hypothetical protein
MGNKKHAVNLMFTITLLGVFALAALFVAVMGAEVYKTSAEKMQANFDTRTSLIYIAEKVRQNPDENYSIGQVGGQDALILTETHEGVDYESWIYVYDEKLCEVLVAAGRDVSPGDGQQIMDLKSLKVADHNGLLTITVVDPKDQENTLSIGKRI